MIGFLRGRVRERSPTRMLLDVSGVGYDVTVTVQNPLGSGQEAELYVYTHVREDTLQLFGFADRRERQLFDLLIGVPGIGPVKAMQILQTPVDDFLAIARERQPVRLAKLPGVGKKTAERLLVDLADKLMALGGAPVSAAVVSSDSPVRDDLVSALINLGYREAPAASAADTVLESSPEGAPIEVLVRTALALLQPHRGKESG